MSWSLCSGENIFLATAVPLPKYVYNNGSSGLTTLAVTWTFSVGGAKLFYVYTYKMIVGSS